MSFYDRIRRSQIATDYLSDFLGEGVQVQGLGVESIGENDSPLRQYLTLISNNYNDATAMMLEYLPDYIIYHNNKVFLLEAKVSITPCWSQQRISDANERSIDDIDASNCGEIAREALLAYKKFFPDTVILYVNNYNRHAVLAQYAKNVECLRCERNRQERYNCAECPLLTGGFYDSVERNQTNGSGTPSTNINLDSFVPAREFFQNEFQIQINETEIRNIENAVLSERLRFGRNTHEQHKKRMIVQIWNAGNHTIKCPECGGELVERINGQTNQHFLGCSNYGDDCRYTVSL